MIRFLGAKEEEQCEIEKRGAEKWVTYKKSSDQARIGHQGFAICLGLAGDNLL